jgi:hypothetical protein
VVKAPSTALFVTLSYVWGSKGQSFGKSDDQESFAKTIVDAIEVTKQLGYRYLWVDKYCIDQDNPTEKHHQINQMDLIYKAADLTIIAVSGRDCYAGLPGVNGTRRKAQREIHLGQYSIVIGRTPPSLQITWSPWVGRAWTFQEGVFSRRRLAFCEDQVYFECCTMSWIETLPPRFDIVKTWDQDAFNNLESGVFSNEVDFSTKKRYGPSSSQLVRYHRSIRIFSTKAVTYREDKLKAFCGIMRDFSRGDLPVFQLWGIHNSQYSRHVSRINPSRMLKEPHVLAQRRESFPSWSWATCSGFVDWHMIGPENAENPSTAENTSIYKLGSIH